MTDIESDDFPDSEGTEQEDPSSSLLDNSVLQYAMEEALRTWREKGLGIKVGDDKKTLHLKLQIFLSTCEAR